MVRLTDEDLAEAQRWIDAQPVDEMFCRVFTETVRFLVAEVRERRAEEVVRAARRAKFDILPMVGVAHHSPCFCDDPANAEDDDFPCGCCGAGRGEPCRTARRGSEGGTK